MTHGDNMKKQPPAEVEAILAENLSGIDREIEGLEWINSRLLEFMFNDIDEKIAEALEDTVSLSSQRSGELRKANEVLDRGKDAKVEQTTSESRLQYLRRMIGETIRKVWEDHGWFEDEDER